MSETSTDSRIEKGRLRRAWALLGATEEVGEGQYRVRGFMEPCYFVDLAQEIPCFCSDAQFNGAKHMCKHELVARLHAHDENVLIAAGEWIQGKQSHRT